MTFTVNGNELILDEETDLKTWLLNMGYRLEVIACELNEEIIDPKDYENIYLKDNDVLEVVSFVGGG